MGENERRVGGRYSGGEKVGSERGHWRESKRREIRCRGESNNHEKMYTY